MKSRTDQQLPSGRTVVLATSGTPPQNGAAGGTPPQDGAAGGAPQGEAVAAPPRSGAVRICRDLAEAVRAEAGGTSRDALAIEAAPGQVAALIRAGWQVIVNADAVDGGPDRHQPAGTPDSRTPARNPEGQSPAPGPDSRPPARNPEGQSPAPGPDLRPPALDPDAAAAAAAAALSAWLGAAGVKSRHAVAVRRAVDMAESIKGMRPLPGDGAAGAGRTGQGNATAPPR